MIKQKNQGRSKSKMESFGTSKFYNTHIKPRGPRTSKIQYQTYVKFLEDNPKFAKCVLSESYNVESRDRDWTKLVKLMNGCQGAKKEEKQWQLSLYDFRKKITVRHRRVTMKNGAERYSKAGALTDLDIRALKAFGKWTDDDTYNTSPELQYDDDDTTNCDDDEGEADDFSLRSEPFEAFEAVPKAEPLEDPIVVYPEKLTKRKIDSDTETREPETSKHSKIIEENTKAIRNHTAALMTLSDTISALTSSIRSYMYSKNAD